MRVLLLALAGCSGALPWGRGGRTDRDRDGWTAADGDCDDGRADVSPLGVDEPLDGVDQDCDGEDDEALDLRAVEPGDLVVTEVMADPVGVSPALGEWFEIANRRDVPVDLRGLLVTDLGTEDFEVLDELVVAGGSYVVIGGHTDEDDNGGAPIDLAWPPGFGLTNDGDAVVLWAGGRELSRVAWDPTWTLLDGASLSLGLGATDPSDRDAWCPGVDVYGIGGRGTPGDPNPPCPPPFEGLRMADLGPGDLVITEIMQNPLATADELGEWFEVLNTSGDAVDLDGLEVAGDGDGFRVEGTLAVAPGAYVVLAAFADPDVNGDVAAGAEWRWAFDLANSGDTIRLSYGTVVIDEVRYDNGLSFPDPEGASMSLDPDELEDNDEGDGWCVAVTPYGEGDLGTPGAPNPSCP